MENKSLKIIDKLKLAYGYGIMIVLFAGGFVSLGYVVAMIMGGDIAETISEFFKNVYIPVMTYVTSTLVIVGIVIMYICKEKSLTSVKK